ncbi:MAG: glycosyltransferase family 2 protein [Candidatus Methanoperedens sp.]|nr:glycosyltransferase family 2 protein [Candidatus Methanoperedens sp.]MCZ7403921.1 glycosyltransferase family 2 protein [Candidatus Methanoperedens sp.]
MGSAITAILPAFNEEVSVGSVVLHAKQHADHVIVIDDGSTDRTAEMAELAGAEVVRHPSNKGKGAALKTGFEAASKNGAKVIVTMDSDGQHDPEEIPKLAAPILAGEADVVNGSRYMNGNRKSTPFYRRIGQNVLDSATNLNSGLHITDTQSGFRAFAVHTLPAFRFGQNGMAIESEMLVDAANAGFMIKEVDIGVRYDVDCSTENPVNHGLKVLINVLYDMELNRSLYYFLHGSIFDRNGDGVKFFGNVLPWRGPAFRTCAVDDTAYIGRDFYGFYIIILNTISRLIRETKKSCV